MLLIFLSTITKLFLNLKQYWPSVFKIRYNLAVQLARNLKLIRKVLLLYKKNSGIILHLDNLKNCVKKFILVSEAQGSGNRLKDETNFNVIQVLNKTYTIRTTDFSNIVFFGGGGFN